MKILITLIISLLLFGCTPPKCKDDETFICGKGCVPIETTITPEKPNEPKTHLEGEPEKQNERKIPSYTTYKISDIVCAWGKDSGVVINIRWSTHTPEGHDNVLVYVVQMPDGRENEYYETELEKGKCN